MLYALFLAVAIIYNWWKVNKSRKVLISSLIEAKSITHREMILSHHFYVFVFEGFLAFIVAHLMTERGQSFNLLGLSTVYLALVFVGFILYRYFVRYLEKLTSLNLQESFQRYLLKEMRVNFALVLLPMVIYSVINITFQEGVLEEWGRWWFVGILFNIIFVSVLTIVCTVIVMLKLIPNREIVEPEYLEIINKRLAQINMSDMRIRWIESDIKNAFVVGLKLFFFSNQTMFLGKSLRTTLTLDEFDAVICHELGHVASKHIQKRVIELLKNFILSMVGIIFIFVAVLGVSVLLLGEDIVLHSKLVGTVSFLFMLLWTLFNYTLLFDTFRSHEYESDAYAVMNLGVSFSSLKSALEKLSQTEDLPEYLKQKQSRKNKKESWMMKLFATHPELSSRLSMLEDKIQRGLPFNYYVSSTQKIRQFVGQFFQWRIFVPVLITFIVVIGWGVQTFKSGRSLIVWIHHASSDEILKNKTVKEKINSSPTIIGPTLVYYIVKKGDPVLIDYYIKKGADKGKTLAYIVGQKDMTFLKKYYEDFQTQLTEDEYFLILYKSAQENFIEGYRYLVNSNRFEGLDPEYKGTLSGMHKSKRLPASVNTKE